MPSLYLKENKRKIAQDNSFVLVFMGDGFSNFEIELTYLKNQTKHYELGDNEIHLAFKVDNFDAAHKKHKEMGCICFENEEMGLYFIDRLSKKARYTSNMHKASVLVLISDNCTVKEFANDIKCC